MCLNRNVLIGLGVVAAGVLLLTPGWSAAALPLLILAICPLSMVFMMRAMNGNRSKDGTTISSGRGCSTPRSAAPSHRSSGAHTDTGEQV